MLCINRKHKPQNIRGKPVYAYKIFRWGLNFSPTYAYTPLTKIKKEFYG